MFADHSGAALLRSRRGRRHFLHSACHVHQILESIAPFVVSRTGSRLSFGPLRTATSAQGTASLDPLSRQQHRTVKNCNSIITKMIPIYNRKMSPIFDLNRFFCGCRLRIAIGWMVQAFSGYLVPEQLLFLWDLILGFDSLLVLPLLAASIFSLRRDNLHRVTSQDAAESILSDLSTIQVVPLLQMALIHPSH